MLRLQSSSHSRSTASYRSKIQPRCSRNPSLALRRAESLPPTYSPICIVRYLSNKPRRIFQVAGIPDPLVLKQSPGQEVKVNQEVALRNDGWKFYCNCRCFSTKAQDKPSTCGTFWPELVCSWCLLQLVREEGQYSVNILLLLFRCAYDVQFLDTQGRHSLRSKFFRICSITSMRWRGVHGLDVLCTS